MEDEVPLASYVSPVLEVCERLEWPFLHEVYKNGTSHLLLLLKFSFYPTLEKPSPCPESTLHRTYLFVASIEEGITFIDRREVCTAPLRN